MRTRSTIEFMGLWEQIHNPYFKGVEFDLFQMMKDPIVQDIRRHRKEYGKENENDLDKIIESLRTRERYSKRKVLNPGPKLRLVSTGTVGGPRIVPFSTKVLSDTP
ncbi:conserved hypothetical protein [Desulfamplus magnetovallimortis]|uniref:Uncharacterized protein n=2 Tax=Desulfamplus magnetovallimortis TaxID=1246637 RepID=A0A1W1HAY1_9BACT|nr:conserved hypothetical protein [Desulfamplus magnetovallimortis]